MTANMHMMRYYSPASLVTYARFSKVNSRSRSRSRNLPVTLLLKIWTPWRSSSIGRSPFYSNCSHFMRLMLFTLSILHSLVMGKLAIITE